MKGNYKTPGPPEWAQRLLAWYCKPKLLEDLHGDLNEYFDRNLKSKGARRARFTYIIDVLKFFRPYTIRKPEFINLLIQWLMLGSYLKTSGRSILRHKLFSVINIAGLAISMSVGLLMIGMLNDLFSYDKFHEKHNRIYRVISQHQYNGHQDDDSYATTSLRAATLIKETLAGPEDVAILMRDFSGDISFLDKTIPFKGFWANESFFNVFSFRLVYGDPATALKEPFSIVLTEESARKMFGVANVLGKTVLLNQEREYTVTGVLKDIPVFSHIKFDMLGSLSTRETTKKDNPNEMAWDNMWNAWTYLLMPEDGDLVALKTGFDKISESEDKTVKHTHIELALQPMDDIMIDENLSNDIGQVMGSTPVWIFSCLAFVVILTACFNYTNLSIARSFRRSREVGIRKTIGALKAHVINQFITESVIIALLALVISFGLFFLIKPHFISMESSLQELLVLDLTPRLVLLFIAFALIVGVSAGFFPALFFARINPVQVLKNLSAIPVFRGVTLRKGLIVFQYCICIIAITATVIIYNQYKHFVAYDLGFTTENILNIRLQGNKAELLEKELSELPEVKGIARSALITSIGNYWGATMRNPTDPADSGGVYNNFVDERYLPLHDHTIIAGRNFLPKEEDVRESEVIVNQQVLKRFNMEPDDPTKAIGQVVKINSRELEIIGVLKDFQYGQANNHTGKEVVIRYSAGDAAFLNVKILSDDWLSTYAKLEHIWKELDPIHPFDAKFYNDQIEEAFMGLKASAKVGGFLALLVICIASIGLLGMVVFTIETRLKEISIRKVLGANELRLLYLLSKGFLMMLLIASAIGLPITYLFFDKVVLREIANHAPISIPQMVVGVLGVLGVALVMIGSQTLKAARTNPAQVLKAE